jgi:asparagine synthase (glutamine-hydrolysing)
MCGICGFIGVHDPAAGVQAVRAMSDALTHRGPDGGGEMPLSSSAGEGHAGWMGHRRLRILDPSSRADQPFVGADGATCLTYNGEVYNFVELRDQLRERGHPFTSSGDTEVVLRAYEEWGPDFVRRLDGMFALALWDPGSGRLVLARDRTGKKPLYYTQSGGGITFASEPKALLTCPWVDPRPDWRRLGELLVFGYVPNPHTGYEGLLQVEPGSIVLYDGSATLRSARYWSALGHDSPLLPGPELDRRISDALRGAVRRRLVADVPLGALLSGGIDSSLVVGLMAEAMDEPVHTFSIGFPEDPSFDERVHARLVARHFATDHTEFEVAVDAVALLDTLVWHHDQPFADSSAIPTYLVSNLARRHVTVALNGDGGDEVFGGYERFTAAAIAPRLPPRAARLARRATSVLPSGRGYHSLVRRAARLLECPEEPVPKRYQAWISVFGPASAVEFLTPETRGLVGETLTTSMDEPYAEAAALPTLDQILYANFTTYLPDDLAVKMDRMSMANSLETRSPFLDTQLIELMARVPARHKVGTVRLKPLLRRALFRELPRPIWNRRKHGFGVPLDRWFDGALAELYQDEVLAHDARCTAVIDASKARDLLVSHRGGERHGARLWTLLTLERWLRLLERRDLGAPPTAPAVHDATEGEPVAAGER